MIENMSPDRMVAIFCMSSYLYYEKNKSVITDREFDLLCKQLIKEWDNITHPHKRLISIDDLEAGSGYRIKYTNMIKDCAEEWYKNTSKLSRK